MKTKIRFFLACLLMQATLCAQSQNESKPLTLKNKKVLIVVTSTGQIKSTGKATGTWLEEFVTPYYALSDAGLDITIASPKGGKGPVDPRSLKAASGNAAIRRFNHDPLAQNKLNNTVALNSVQASDYDAVFYPGGHGPMWDLPDDSTSIRLIESFYNAGKPVALVCHAPAALKNVKDKTGSPLIKGKQVTGYSNSEETTGKTTDATPFLLEDMLKEKGGLYTQGKNWQAYSVQDGNLITGQNPASAAGVADKLLAALKVPALNK